MIKDFFILDFSYEIKGNTPLVYIWSVDDEGNSSVVIDNNFRPYFYIIYEGNENEIIENIKKNCEALQITKVKRKYLGNIVDALLIQTSTPTQIKKCREKISELNNIKGIFDADIRYTMRYSLDFDLRPFTWFRAEVNEVKFDGFRTKKAYILDKILSHYEGNMPELRTIGVDFQIYSKYGSLNPRKDPIVVMSLWSKEGPMQFSLDEGIDDLKIIRRFVDYILNYDPDIIFVYDSDLLPWKYITERASSLGVKIDIGRKIGSEVSVGTYGHYSISGRLNVDLTGLLVNERSLGHVDLIDVSNYLGISPSRYSFKWYEISRYWDNEKNRRIIREYSIENARSIYLLGNYLLSTYSELVKIVGLPLDKLSVASWGNRIETSLIRTATKSGELIPIRMDNPNRPSKIKKNIIIQPKVGIYTDVYVLDISSVYSLVIRKFNIAPDTLVKEQCDDCYSSPISNYKFKREPSGLYKTFLDELSNVRDSNKIKVIEELISSFNDYVHWVNARWYSREIASAFDEFSNEIIRFIIDLIKSSGLDVILANDLLIFVTGGSRDKVNELITKINSLYNLDVKVKIFYKSLLVLDNNRYAGLSEGDKIDIARKGEEDMNLCELARNIKRKIIEEILISKDVKKAIKLVKSTVIKLRRGEFDNEELITWAKIERDLNEYNNQLPFVTAARKAIQSGYLISKDSKIGYVIVKGLGPLNDRAEPFFLVKEKNRIDIEYYVDQIFRETLKLLKPLGVNEESLKKTNITDILDLFGASKKK
ncbi:DNA polymerase [Saccharolobus solfataricus]|uniref:DNA polymerase 3 n=3 Tax=Saccharolobus solfataricus TaxID=2287 RepID=DPOL3_SACS2|nr:DNA-directed DNA polymerase [Saccharolobus solfataricus]P95979.1 RecName: Full=DNA polymerase 3; AltName: Full=DNA polymerase B3; AltName: Full=DNA polymerase III [Saccharolobus solfataricus P2]AAK40441.1 DNA polymerase III (DNA polymerase B3) (pfu polymerase). (dpo3) [Saccharolobus solfataricus P2]AKA73427.1 DNA polymerase [Saccharolobus solfataricus]AKA76125.1 DNA polymerase [Saccharolobus solfataricus]AKA78817.1 DNA polymerase [Saccharolobus solfataricus]AZF67892.1 DNA polymerase [Sacch